MCLIEDLLPSRRVMKLVLKKNHLYVLLFVFFVHRNTSLPAVVHESRRISDGTADSNNFIDDPTVNNKNCTMF